MAHKEINYRLTDAEVASLQKGDSESLDLIEVDVRNVAMRIGHALVVTGPKGSATATTVFLKVTRTGQCSGPKWAWTLSR